MSYYANTIFTEILSFFWNMNFILDYYDKISQEMNKQYFNEDGFVLVVCMVVCGINTRFKFTQCRGAPRRGDIKNILSGRSRWQRILFFQAIIFLCQCFFCNFAEKSFQVSQLRDKRQCLFSKMKAIFLHLTT